MEGEENIQGVESLKGTTEWFRRCKEWVAFRCSKMSTKLEAAASQLLLTDESVILNHAAQSLLARCSFLHCSQLQFLT